jgi:hypothetical protein
MDGGARSTFFAKLQSLFSAGLVFMGDEGMCIFSREALANPTGGGNDNRQTLMSPSWQWMGFVDRICCMKIRPRLG